MLRAYFDDSGTHYGSKVVVVAGIMGSESDLLSLELSWRELLNDPVCGLKPAIAEFHAYDCFESKGEFQGWRRSETDFFRRQLRQAIINSHVSAYGIAYFKQDWDDIIQGALRNLFGNAEGNAVRNCFVRALKWANTNCFDTDLSFIFDQSDDLTRKRDVLAVYDAFLRHGDEIKLGGVSFLNSREALHLQAADMFAWEFNRNAHKILENRSETTSTDEYMELGKGVKWMDAQIVRKDTIIRMKDFAINQHSPKTLAVMADYFKEFAPALAGKKRLKRRVDTSASVRADRR